MADKAFPTDFSNLSTVDATTTLLGDDGSVNGNLTVADISAANTHALGGTQHSADTLANLNAKVSDATLIDTTDSRLSDDRDPNAHASEHTDGTDDIQDATAGQKGLATAAQITKLDGIEALADVTDATNVDAAGATMNADTTLAGNGWFLDQDNMGDDDATKVPSQQSVKAYVDALVQGAIILQGDWNASTNTPDISTTTTTGYAWRVSVAGSTNLGGITDWAVNDLAVKTAASWLKIDNEDIAAIWGNVTGTLSNQTDLQNALDGKAAATHAAQHTNGTDDIQNATNAQKGLATAAQITNLEANTTHRGSDGTDHANVVLNDTHRGSNGTDHANVVLNDTHRGSDGKDHSDVVLNNTHRASNGTDHANVVLNDTHRGSDGKDHSDVVLNNTHRASDGTDHSNVVLNDTHRSSDGTDHTYIDQDLRTTAGPTHTAMRLTTLNTGDNIITTDTDGDFQESGVKVETAPAGGSGFTVAEYASAPTSPPSGFLWVQAKDGSTKTLNYYDGSSTYSVDLST